MGMNNKELTRKAFRLALIEADFDMKQTNGHSFLTVLKTRCVYCRKSPKVKTKCGRWFDTFNDCLERRLIERGYMSDQLDPAPDPRTGKERAG